MKKWETACDKKVQRKKPQIFSIYLDETRAEKSHDLDATQKLITDISLVSISSSSTEWSPSMDKNNDRTRDMLDLEELDADEMLVGEEFGEKKDKSVVRESLKIWEKNLRIMA